MDKVLFWICFVLVVSAASLICEASKNVERGVYVGRVGVAGGLAWHMAVGIKRRNDEYEWYEVDGTGKTDNGPNTINGGKPAGPYVGKASRIAVKTGFSTIKYAGVTKKNNDAIAEWNKQYLLDHPVYYFELDNCQDYANALVQWLTGNQVWTYRDSTDIVIEFLREIIRSVEHDMQCPADRDSKRPNIGPRALLKGFIEIVFSYFDKSDKV